MEGIIYKYTSPSGKSYIGLTKHSLKYRWDQHLSEANHPEWPQSRVLTRALLKWGFDNFTKEVIWRCPLVDLLFWESAMIILHNTLAPNGYNLIITGQYSEVSQETRNLLSLKLKGKPKNVKDNRKRPEDNKLPKYLKHYVDKKVEGYRISAHPNCKTSKSFTNSEMTMDEKYKLAVDYLEKLDANEIDDKPKELPIGIQFLKNGYRVRYQKHPVKTFEKSKMTMPEKLDQAINYLNTLK